MDSTLIPLAGISVGIIVPLAVFYWQYHEVKNKNETITEIAKSIDDPAKLEELMPIDYRRGGIITIFVGIGLYLLGFVVMGRLFEGVGLLVAAIGVGSLIAGYLYPNTSEEINKAVEEYEKK